MIKNFTIKTLILSIGLMISAAGSAQNNDCSSSISEAGVLYEKGDFNTCIELLNSCLGDIKHESKFEAYRLLALSYLELKDEEKLDEAIVNLLKIKPNYREFPYFDPLPFTRKLSEYDVYPRWEIGLSLGINSTSISPIENFSVTGSKATFIPKTGYQVGIMTEYFFNKRTSLNGGLQFSGVSYGRNADDVVGWKQEYSEKLQFINVPLYFRYNLVPNFIGWSLSLDAGISNQFLASTRSVVFLDNLSESNPNVLQKSTDQSETRNKYLIAGLLGVSAKRHMLGGSFSVEVGSTLGLNNLVKAENRWDNLEFISESNYVDSDIRLNTLMLNICYKRAIRGKYAVERKK